MVTQRGAGPCTGAGAGAGKSSSLKSLGKALMGEIIPGFAHPEFCLPHELLVQECSSNTQSPGLEHRSVLLKGLGKKERAARKGNISKTAL